MSEWLWGIRSQVSLLIDHGHPHAADYSLSAVWDECQLVVERENRAYGMQAVILQSAAATAVAAFGKDGGKKAHKQFADFVKKLSGDSSFDPPKKNLTEKLNKDRTDNGR